MIATALALLLAALPARAAPPEVEAAWASADASVRSGDYRGAAARYRALLDDLSTRPSREAPEAAWTQTLLRLAVVEATLGNAPSSREAVERALAIDPALSLDPDLYSPAFRRDLEAARARVAARPRFTLRVTSPAGAGQAFVQGRSIGPLPAEARLPAGTWRVGVEGGGRERTVTVELARDETVVVDPAAPPPDLTTPLPSAPIAAVQPAPDGAWMRPVAWTAAGLALVSAGVATWQGIAAGNSWSEAKGMLQPDGTLKPGVDPAQYAAARNAYDTQSTVAWVTGIGAVALGAGATVLFLLAPSAPVEPAPGGVAVRF
ncbi:MAG TPA: hypothetical protein VFM45_09485 [Anaeromyxobacteraceae bacterium]|nr:hypothetical protein [Anaeromyxobacteraceae bacterium]